MSRNSLLEAGTISEVYMTATAFESTHTNTQPFNQMTELWCEYFFLNWDSPHARLNSHCEAWNYKKKSTKKITGYRKSV